jgi:hypothetical protein
VIGTGACLVCDFVVGVFILLACLGVAFIALRNCPPPQDAKVEPENDDG